MTRGFGRFLRRNTIALLALFLVLGGTSYAAGTLISGSQIKKHSIAKNRLTNKAIKQLKGNRGPAGTQGAQGARGPTGSQGVQGVPGPITGDLPVGVTLRGDWGLEGKATVSLDYLGGAVTFNLRPPAAPAQNFIADGATPPPACPGTYAAPEAAAGNLCVYESTNNFNATVNVFAADTGLARYGFDYEVTSVSSGSNFWSYGTWAMTAAATASPQHKPSAARPVGAKASG